MERDEELRRYRDTLVRQLHSQECLRAEACPDTLQIFVNHRCVGSMDCNEGRATFVSGFEGEEITLVEVRADSGVLVASASGLGGAERTRQVRIGDRHTLSLVLKNEGGRGFVKVFYEPAEASLRHWASLVHAPLGWIGSFIRQAGRAFADLPLSTQASLALQTVLAVSVAFLLLHATGGRLQKDQQQTPPTPQVTSGDQQTARIGREIETLAKDLQLLREQIAYNEKSAARSAIEIEHRVERRLLPELQKATLEMVQVRQQVQELTSAKEALKQELAAALKQQAETFAKLKLQPSLEGPQPYKATTSPLLSQAEEPPKVAGGPRPEEFKPIIFWVSFQEGTSEGPIQEFFHQIRGRKLKGPTPTGWINVEAQLKQSETIEGFFEAAKKSKIVRAITTSLSGQ